ncbi:MAG: type II toxin-antitoxin system Phd/YefM family antitoxin [Lachnospiraceae bacterium]|nr:type II toxin-antitoxin system Phd/YefM family antitoxin [Lachnospiraceae bacterium]
MPNIKPVSDLRNYAAVLQDVSFGAPVFLTKNGYGSMVVLSLELYSKLAKREEYIMDIADSAAESTEVRLSHEEVFGSLRRKLNHGSQTVSP